MQRILFPVDFSPQCDALVPAVAAMARRFRAQLTVMHVMASGSLETDLGRFHHHFATLAEEIEGLVQRYHSAEFQGLNVDRVFKIGRPAEEIVEFARHSLTELIMMPTHGRTRFRELLLGSVTSGVLHDTESAVWTSAHLAASRPWAEPRSVLCAIDMSPFSGEVLDMADHIAIHCRADLHVVHAVTGEIAPQLDMRVEDARDRYPALAAYAEVKQPLEMINGDTVNQAILAACDRYAADLLVVGRGQMQGILGRLRSGVHDLIRRAPCPVLSV